MRVVQETSEFRRVRDLPARELALDETFARSLSALLRADPSATLRPIQAAACYEMSLIGGLFGPIRVGAGKTLISLLAPVILDSSRPLLLLPAKLIAKTKRELGRYIQQWHLPRHIRMLSYEMLGRESGAGELTRYRPDLLICDEAHKLKNPRAACTRRVARYCTEHAPRVVAMSGTISKRSIRDYAHLLPLVYRHAPIGPPIPMDFNDLINWADAIDEKSGSWFGSACDPGALVTLTKPEDWADSADEKTAVRRAYRRRLVSTPGVVSTYESPIDASLYVIQSPKPQESPALDFAFHNLITNWQTPDGTELMDGMEVHRHATTLGLGFYYHWDPPAPRTWNEPRKAYAQLVRKILQTNRRDLDSELQVRKAIREGFYPEAAPALEAWERVKETFRPQSVPVWLDDAALRYAAHWLHTHKGIAWTSHTAFGERLAELAGVGYYGAKGIGPRGRMIEDAEGPIVASLQANCEGRNLQRYNTNLLLPCPPTGAIAEQLIGRTHRDGQQADEVTVECYVGCAEHSGAIEQAISDARYLQHTTGQPQKLLLADVATELWVVGPRWYRDQT